jgi:hypothetical protein
MAKNLKIYAPIEIPFLQQTGGTAKQIRDEDVTAFWAKAHAAVIENKQGCYVFALRAAKGYQPWYVGKATKNFKQECFTDHKLRKYNEVLFDGRKGTPVMFFVAPSGNVSKVPEATCDEIETFLIQAAYVENPDIKNRQKTKIPEWTIEGVVRPDKGMPSKIAKVFKTMLGLV